MKISFKETLPHVDQEDGKLSPRQHTTSHLRRPAKNASRRRRRLQAGGVQHPEPQIAELCDAFPNIPGDMVGGSVAHKSFSPPYQTTNRQKVTNFPIPTLQERVQRTHRLNSADFPTFGRPTRMTVGRSSMSTLVKSTTDLFRIPLLLGFGTRELPAGDSPADTSEGLEGEKPSKEAPSAAGR